MATRSPGVLRRAVGSLGAVAALWLALASGCSPLHAVDADTTSTPRPQVVDDVTARPIAVLGVVTPAGLQGFGPVLAHALDASLAAASPAIPDIPPWETVSRLNEHGLAAHYADAMSGYARSGILDRDQMRRIGPALGCRHVLLPGLAQLEDVFADRFEAMGIKIVRNRIVTLRLWLQLWDTESGRIVWESSGEATTSSMIVFGMRAVPLDAMAQRLWSRMLRDGLLPERRLLAFGGADGATTRREAP
jgi:hypothetical protein